MLLSDANESLSSIKSLINPDCIQSSSVTTALFTCNVHLLRNSACLSQEFFYLPFSWHRSWLLYQVYFSVYLFVLTHSR